MASAAPGAGWLHLALSVASVKGRGTVDVVAPVLPLPGLHGDGADALSNVVEDGPLGCASGGCWSGAPADGFEVIEEGLVQGPPPSAGREVKPAADLAGVTLDFQQAQSVEQAGELTFLAGSQGGQDQVQVGAEGQREATHQQHLPTVGKYLGAGVGPERLLDLWPGSGWGADRNCGVQGEPKQARSTDLLEEALPVAQNLAVEGEVVAFAGQSWLGSEHDLLPMV